MGEGPPGLRPATRGLATPARALAHLLRALAAHSYRVAKESGVLTEQLIASLYGCAAGDVLAFDCPNILAMKFSIPRPAVQGSFGDPDLHGGQQHAPLMRLRLPRPTTTRRAR
jgi:hypothetical protein